MATTRGRADIGINYTEGDWVAEVKRATADRGAKSGLVDVVFDPVGLAMESSKVVSGFQRTQLPRSI